MTPERFVEIYNVAIDKVIDALTEALKSDPEHALNQLDEHTRDSYLLDTAARCTSLIRSQRFADPAQIIECYRQPTEEEMAEAYLD